MRMIPSQISPGTKSTAERRLFEALGSIDVSQGWACMHSVDLPDHLLLDGRDVIIVRYWRGCFGSSEPVLRGGICPKRSSGHGGRCMDATANGARKASGSG